MAPNYIIEYTIFKISYVPFAIPNSSYIMSRKKRSATLISAAAVAAWHHTIMTREQLLYSPNVNVRYSEWCFKTNDKELMTLSNNLFDDIYVFLGGEIVYWLYHNCSPEKFLQNSANFTVAFCPCCLHLQYSKIINMIRTRMSLEPHYNIHVV